MNKREKIGELKVVAVKGRRKEREAQLKAKKRNKAVKDSKNKKKYVKY